MPTKIFLKIHFEFAYYSFFLIYLELKRLTHSCTPVENHTRIQTKTGKVYTPVSDQNGAKTIPFKAAYTYMANVRENPSPPGGGELLTRAKGSKLAEVDSAGRVTLFPGTTFLHISKPVDLVRYRAT